MNADRLACPNCKHPIPTESYNTGALHPCPNCELPVLTELFPAAFRPADPATAAERILISDQASCFFHPQKKALVTCDGCGRFLCALCDLELDQKHFCPSCLAFGQASVERLENHRILYDNSALALAILPILAWPLTLITAPATVALVIYGWKKPASVVGRTRFRSILALFLAVLQIIGWFLILVMVLAR